ncbi:MAG: helix-turn-helix transcriptional regulator [Clostridia bacterium]|nr:helix-turn-helix transcriptional regulator [Clostridia bacterium]
MNQEKIGKFIAERRKKNNLTQLQLSEKLNVTDRAVSKWENGKSLPDSSIMLALCKELNITVNDLLNGEIVDMDNQNEKKEKIILELVKQKEETDKRLLLAEIVIGVCCVIPLIVAIIIVNIVAMEEWQSAVLILASLIPLLVATPFAIKIEQKAGYYECGNCGHKYVPKYQSVFMAMHMGRTRYMKCPNCGKRTWNKKVIKKD